MLGKFESSEPALSRARTDDDPDDEELDDDLDDDLVDLDDEYDTEDEDRHKPGHTKYDD